MNSIIDAVIIGCERIRLQRNSLHEVPDWGMGGRDHTQAVAVAPVYAEIDRIAGAHSLRQNPGLATNDDDISVGPRQARVQRIEEGLTLEERGGAEYTGTKMDKQPYILRGRAKDR